MKLLFVCMGNICRSPTAHGIFRQLVLSEGLAQQIEIDSAGTHAYHIGEQPDPRSIQTALSRGIDVSDLRARQVTEKDFAHYDLILAMDRDNLFNLLALCPDEHADRVKLLLSFAADAGLDEVPDPYYGGSHGFEHVFDLVDTAARGLLDAIRDDVVKANRC